MRLHVKVRYAPLPEESTSGCSSSGEGGCSSSPAAVEYCQRAARLFLRLNDGDESVQMKREVVVDIEPLPDDAGSLQQDDGNASASTSENQTTTSTTTTTLYLFIISCAADGSVHRSVRKFARSLAKLKTDTATNAGCSNNNNCFAVTLLGHARCDNSAKQMASTIYGAGWRLEKSLLQAASLLFPLSLEVVASDDDHERPTRQQKQRCETQVELEGPDVKFDPWIMALAQSMSSSSSSPPSHSIQSVTQEKR